MSNEITKKEIIKEVGDFIKRNAIDYDDISIEVKIEKSHLLTTESIKEGRFFGTLKEEK